MSASITKVVLRGDFNAADQTRNIFYLWNANGTICSDTTAQNWMDSIFGGGMWDHTVTSWHTRSVDLYLWDAVQSYWAFYSSFPYAHAGANGNATGGQQLAYVWVARTGVKRVVPKKFIPGVPYNDAPGGLLTAPLIAINQAAANCWATTQVQAGEQFVPGTFMQNHAFTPILDVKVDSTVGTQRRRKQGVGF